MPILQIICEIHFVDRYIQNMKKFRKKFSTSLKSCEVSANKLVWNSLSWIFGPHVNTVFRLESTPQNFDRLDKSISQKKIERAPR